MTAPVPFFGGVTGLGGLLSAADFILPFNDLGSGEVDLTLQRGGVSATFARATTAWTKLSSGLWASVASGTARSFYGGFTTATGSYLGYLAEAARTNSCLQARDLTNASWTKTSTTAAKNATGIDGTASSASTLTASGANGTCLQAFTIVSAAKTFSAFVRRKTGTGNVFITLDNDLTRTDVTASINSTTYARVSMTQTLADPTVGFKLATSGDEIEIDMCQLEDSASFASTPIPTTTVALTRNLDSLTYLTTGWLNASEGTMFAQFTAGPFSAFATSQTAFSLNDTTANERAALFRQATTDTGSSIGTGGGVTQWSINRAAIAAEQTVKMACAYAANDIAAVLDGAAAGTDTSATLPTVTQAQIGHANQVTHLFGGVRHIAYWARRLPNQTLQALTA